MGRTERGNGMEHVTVDMGKSVGRVKPMHCVNNGPEHRLNAQDQEESNLGLYKAAGIPYARTHDASIHYGYGGEHVVDVTGIFPDFDADPYDPESYDFQLTDEYLKVISLAGTKVFYRLGSKIEHWSKKYGTLPPKDFQKWAVICEHIIRHYNEGWANGFSMGIEYWEVWNEADLDGDDAANKRTWGGTAKAFYELFDVTVSHLKTCFPHLKIGGPAVCSLNEKWLNGLFERLTAPIDFFSWHIYAREPEAIFDAMRRARRYLDEKGMKDVPSILNEWNYVTGFAPASEWYYSRKMEKGIKGAAFIGAVMCGGQYEPLDMLMYYDARPCGMNGMFDTDFPSEPLKGYYPFVMFNELYKLGTAVKAEADCGRIYACAARGEKGFAAMAVHFDDDDEAAARQVKLSVRNAGTGKKKIKMYLLDRDNDMRLMREEESEGETWETELDMPLFSAWLIRAEEE